MQHVVNKNAYSRFLQPGNLSKVRSKHQQTNTQTYYWYNHILGVAPWNRLIMANQNK